MLVLRKLLLFALTFLIATTAILFFGQRQFIYPAPQERLAQPPPGYRFVETETSDGLTLRAAYHPAKEGKPTLLFFHGNGDSLIGAHAATQIVTQAGYGALLVEYRGYGGNPGSPGEQGFYRDGEAAIAWLGKQGIPPARLIIVGNSIGSGPATEMAVRHQPAGLALVSPFSSLPDAVSGIYPFIPSSLLLRDRFDNNAKIGKVKSPTLIVHGDADALIGHDQAEQLGKARGVAPVIVGQRGHELAYTPEAQILLIEWLADFDA